MSTLSDAYEAITGLALTPAERRAAIAMRAGVVAPVRDHPVDDRFGGPGYSPQNGKWPTRWDVALSVVVVGVPVRAVAAWYRTLPEAVETAVRGVLAEVGARIGEAAS